jgi:hypothetical protein
LLPAIVVVALIEAFLAAHQLLSTGFYTSGYSPLLAGLVYTSIAAVVATTAVDSYRAGKDTRFVVNLAASLIWTVTAAWLWFSFPLDFTHLPDVVPSELQIAFSWITNYIGKVFIGIMGVGAAVFIPFDIRDYIRARSMKGKAMPSPPRPTTS